MEQSENKELGFYEEPVTSKLACNWPERKPIWTTMWNQQYLFNYVMIICFMSLFRVLDVYQIQFIVTLLFLSFVMFIDSFRGLGTSLVEGCAGDFRPNTAECERVHLRKHQRASDGIRQSRSRTFAPMPRTTAQVPRTVAQLGKRPPDSSSLRVLGQFRIFSVFFNGFRNSQVLLGFYFIYLYNFNSNQGCKPISLFKGQLYQ